MTEKVDELEKELDRAFTIMERVRKLTGWGRREWQIFILGGICSLGLYAFVQWIIWSWQVMVALGVW